MSTFCRACREGRCGRRRHRARLCNCPCQDLGTFEVRVYRRQRWAIERLVMVG